MPAPSPAPLITIAGTGAVSAAGWGVPALLAAVEKGVPLPLDPLPWPGDTGLAPLTVRLVPKPSPRPAFLAHPRLRRSSPVSQYASAAAMEAMGLETAPAGPDKSRRTGIIFTLLNGCVNYSGRFFGETRRDPATASPILFPETVFNAPASHLASLLGSDAPAFTLIGDSAHFISGVELAVQWLLDGAVDTCVVVGAEEADPLTAGALRMLSPGAVLSEGAGALYLERNGRGPVISEIAGPVVMEGIPSRAARTAAALALRKSVAFAPHNPGQPRPGTVLVDDANGCPRSDFPGRTAWQDWTGPRLSPRQILGEAPGASTALQCVLAAAAVQSGKAGAAVVSAIGADQQASALVLESPAEHRR